MTCREAMVEIWEMIGEPDDLSPYTDPNDTSTFSMTLTGSSALLRALNAATKAVATFKDKVTGRHFRIRDCIAERYVASSVTTGTDTGSGSTTTIVLDTAESASNTLRGALAVVNSEARLIVSNTTTTATVHKAFSSTAASQAYSIYRRWIDVPSSATEDERLYEVLSVYDMEDEQEVERARGGDLLEDTILEYDVPGSWTSTGSRIWFDYHVEDTRYFKVNFYQLPAELTSSDESTELPLPDPFHYAVVLWCCAWGFRRSQDPDMAYVYDRKLEDFMRVTATEYDVTSAQGREAYGRVVAGRAEV